MKFGGELRRDQIKVSFINRPNGDYTFTEQYSGNAAADFLLGFSDAVPAGHRRSEPGRLVVDVRDLRAGRIPASDRDMTLNYGVRYEVNQPFAEKPGSPQRVPSRSAVDGVPERADRPGVSGRYRRAATALLHRQEQHRAAARRRSGTRAATAAPACARRGACSTTRCRDRATSSRTARSRRRSSR